MQRAALYYPDISAMHYITVTIVNKTGDTHGMILVFTGNEDKEDLPFNKKY